LESDSEEAVSLGSDTGHEDDFVHW